jgi:hypothetical protein
MVTSLLPFLKGECENACVGEEGFFVALEIPLAFTLHAFTHSPFKKGRSEVTAPLPKKTFHILLLSLLFVIGYI